METSSIAKRYARALHEYAAEGQATDAVRADCVAIRQLTETSSDFSSFIANPTLLKEVADQAIDALFTEKAHAVTLRFLHFLIAQDRLNHLQGICDAYEQNICEALGILPVKITAAHALSDDQLTSIRKKLKGQYKQEIATDVIVDPSLMGGFKIQVGDHIRDFSISTKLNEFEKSVIYAAHQHSR